MNKNIADNEDFIDFTISMNKIADERYFTDFTNRFIILLF